jgi:hypothetical protein
MNLEQIATALISQKPENPVEILEAEATRLERFGNIAFAGFAAVIALGIAGLIFVIITRMILSGTQPFTGALLAAFIVFAALSLAYVFWRESLKDKRAGLVKRGRANLARPEGAELQLNSATFQPAASITERTTRDLSVHPRDRQ